MGSAGNGPYDYYADGDWNAICSMCGHKFKASMLRKHWQGQWRCWKCWEPRQPQDFVKATPDHPTPPWTQPDEWTDTSAYIQTCSIPNQIAVAGIGVAGCMRAGFLPPNWMDYITNPVPPALLPVPLISTPLDGATVSGTISITFSTVNSSYATSASLDIDGSSVSTAFSGTYSWDTTLVADGPHNISFTVIDTVGTPHDVSIEVTVSNAVPTVSASFYSIVV